MEIFANIRVRRQVRELLIEIQRSIEAGKMPLVESVHDGKPVKEPLFHRPPGLPDILEKAVLEFREKYGLP